MLTDFPGNLRRQRELCDLSQVDLARLMRVTKQSVSAWESGKREPDLATVAELAAVLGCTADDLIGPKAPT